MFKTIIILIAVVSGVAGFFQYEDCGSECASRSEACTIDEISSESFIVTCFTDQEACMSEATPNVVCIPPTGTPHGGEAIWSAYQAWRSHTTTTPPATTTTTQSPTTTNPRPTTIPTTPGPVNPTTPRPVPTPTPSRLWWLPSAINLLLISLVSGAVYSIYRIVKRRGYERIDLQPLPVMPEEDEL